MSWSDVLFTLLYLSDSSFEMILKSENGPQKSSLGHRVKLSTKKNIVKTESNFEIKILRNKMTAYDLL